MYQGPANHISSSKPCLDGEFRYKDNSAQQFVMQSSFVELYPRS